MKSAVLKRVISFVLAMLFIYSATPFVFAVESGKNDKLPFESFEIGNLEIVEHTHGYDYGTYYYYDISGDVRIKITLKDGKTEEYGGYGLFYNGEWYSLSITTNQSEDAPWTAGNTYEVTGTIQGLSTVFSVTIIESPFESLTIDDMEIIEYTHGSYRDTYYNYELSDTISSFRLGLKDGTEIISPRGYGINYHGIWYSLSITTDQSEDNPWTAGNTYEATGSILGATAVFNVKIFESPVVSVNISDIDIYVGTHGYFNGAFYYYDFFSPDLNVTLADGAVIKSTGGFEYNGEWYTLSITTDQSEDNPWTVGNTYVATGSILGASADFNITIAESPVVGIRATKELIIDIDVFPLNDMVLIDLMHAGIQVDFADGTTVEDASGYGEIIYDGDEYYCSCPDSIDLADWHGAGKYSIPVTVFSYTQEVEINIIENPYWYLEFSYTDKQFKVIFTKTNGEKEERQVTWFSAGLGGLGYIGGSLYTPDRVYEAYFTYSYTLTSDDEYIEYLSKNVQLQIGNMKSNVIENFEWLAVNQWAESSLLTLGVLKGSNFGASVFNGYTRGEEYDVDSIISLACALEDVFNSYDEFEDEQWYVCWYISVNDIKDAVEKVFGITDLDITKSVNYDPNEPDKLLVRFFGAYGGGNSQVKMRYENGLWIIDESRGNSKMTVAVTDDLVIEKIEYFQNNKKGDFDGDGKITVADALSALRIAAKLVPLDEESKAIGDIDGDGEITVSDALAILRVAAKLADSL